MKIGIFGDSYADPTQMNPTSTWIDILSKKHEVKSHAVSGSNLYYSITEINKYYANYDYLVLVVTSPGRIKIPNKEIIGNLNQLFISGISTISHLEKTLNQNEQWMLKCYNAAKDYFIYLQDYEYEKYIHELMLNDVKARFSNIVVIPGFTSSGKEFSDKTTMYEIYLKETLSWQENAQSVKEKYVDIRNCHMTAENNDIFATKVEEWIAGAPVVIDLNEFVTPTNKEFYLLSNE